MGKNLQERIKDIEEYRPNITFQDGALVVKIIYKKNWQVLQPEDTETIAFSKDDNVPDLYWYVALLENADYIFDLIEKTIAVNKEMEKKISLYETKINELRELFLSDMSFEKLETLQFVFNTPKNKRSYNKTKKVVEQTEQILTTIEPTTEEILIDNPYYEEPLTIKQEDITFDNEIDNKINKAIEEQTK
jgi:hypothetical protein